MSAENPKTEGSPKSEEELKKQALDRLKEQKKVVLINAEDLAEKEARDTADAHMTLSMEDKKGIVGYVKKLWKHTLFDEYYRQKELNRVRKEIQDKGNIYAGQEDTNFNHKTAMDAVMDRFSAEYEGTLSKDEEKKVLNKEDQETKNVTENIKKLIYEYAEGTLNYDNFVSEKNRVLDSLKNNEVLKGANTYTDNLLEIAKNARIAIEHGAKMKELDLDFEIIIGKAKSSIKTEAHLSLVDKAVEKIQKTSVGKFINPATMSVAVGLAYSIGVNIGGKKILRSKVSHAITLGGSAVLSGALMGMDENERLAKERSQHAREMAKGGAVEAGDKRRELFEKYRHETKNSKDLEKNLNELVFTKYKGKETTGEDLNKMINCMSEIEARIAISDKNKIDLISYSSPGSVEKERTDLIILLARAKVELRKKLEGELSNLLGRGETFDSMLKNKNQVVEGTLLGGKNSGIEAKDKEFRAFKRKEVAKKILKTTLASVVIGGTVQEIAAFFKDDVQGFFEGMFKNDLKAQTDTPVQHAVNWMTGRDSSIPMGESVDVKIDDHFIKMPEGTNIVKNPDGTFDILRDGTVIVDNAPLKFDTDGLLDQNSVLILGEHGIVVGSDCKVLEDVGAEEVSAKDYVHENMDNTQHIKRDLWYDNNTPKPVFDKNELKLWWGGENNSGMDGKGNYVFNIAHMTKGGSFHENFSVDAQEKIKSGGLKMILSLTRDTQNQVFEVPIDTNGNAIIDPNSEIGKLFFSNENGHAVFQGKYAEVAETFGETDGTEHVKILATHVGEGNDCIEIPKDDEVPINYLEIPRDVEPPMFIPPVLSHRPLEPIGKRKIESPDFGGTYGDETYLDRDSIYEDPTYGDSSSEFYGDNEMDTTRENLTQKDIEGNILSMEEYLKNHVDLEVMKELDGQIGEPMSNDTRMSVVLPCYKEGSNIYKTLTDWTTAQKDLKPEELEIIAFVNAPNKDQELDVKTLSEIVRFKTEHPEYKIRLVKHNFDFENKRKMGAIYKAPSDLALYRNLKRLENAASKEIVSSHLMRAGGADALGRNPRFLREVIDFMDRHPGIEQLRTQSAYPAEVREKFPLFNLITVFNHSLSALYTRGNSNVGLGTFRSRIYAEAGGFDSDREVREEIDLGKRIREKVGRNSNAINKLVKKNAVDNPRRELLALARGDTVLRAYKDFSDPERDKELRDFDWSKDMPKNMQKNVEINVKNMNREFDAYFQHYLGKTNKESGIISKTLRGALNEKTLKSGRFDPETRLLLKDPEIASLIQEINTKIKSGETITRTSPEAQKMSEVITKKLFDRILRVTFGLQTGTDFEYKKSKDNDSLHIEFKTKTVTKLKKALDEKWKNFDGYWTDKKLNSKSKEVKDNFPIDKVQAILDKDPVLKAQHGSLVENYLLFKGFGKWKDSSPEKVKIMELYKAYMDTQQNKNFTVEDFVQSVLLGTENELNTILDADTKEVPVSIENKKLVLTKAELETEINENLKTLLEKIKDKEPELKGFKLVDKGNSFNVEFGININKTGLIWPANTAEIGLVLPLENKDNNLALGEYELKVKPRAGKGAVEGLLKPQLSQILPNIQKYLESKNNIKIKGMKIENGTLVLEY